MLIPSQPADITNGRTLKLCVWALFAAQAVYIGFTYLAKGPARPPAPTIDTMILVLECAALLSVAAGFVVERVMLKAADTAAAVASAVIITASLGETSAILGLLVFFMSGRRVWPFFVLAFLYFVRLVARLPEFARLMDETGPRNAPS